MALGNGYGLVNSTGGIKRWDDYDDPNASQSQQANRNAQGGWDTNNDTSSGDGWVAQPAQAAQPAAGGRTDNWSNFTLSGYDDPGRDPGEQYNPQAPEPQPAPQQTPGGRGRHPGPSPSGDTALWNWWQNWQRNANDPRVEAWWGRYAPTVYGDHPTNIQWQPSANPAWFAQQAIDPAFQSTRDHWLRNLQQGWHQGFLHDRDPYQEGLTYYKDQGGADYNWTGTQWRTGVPTGYHLDPETSELAGYKDWAKENNIVGPWTAGHADFASWRDDAQFRNQWAQNTLAAFQARGGGGGIYADPPDGINAEDSKWDQWLRTDGGRDHTSANILGFLQTHYGGQFNKTGLAAALPIMQWLFGSHIKIVGSGGDKIDFGPPLGVVDLIRDVKGEHGGTAWIWLPDKDNTNLHGGGGGRGAAGAGGGQYGGGPPGGYQPGAGGWQQNPYGSGQGGWFDPTQTPVVNFPAPGVSSQYAPGAPPADGLPTYGGYQFTNEGLPVYQQFQYDPNMTYQAGQVGQFSPLDQSGLNQVQRTTVQQMLENPTLSDQVLAQMREQHKDTVLSMGEQLGQQAAQRAAAQGTFGGGQYGSSLGDIQRSMAGDITKGYRDLNVQAADINRQARERALGLSEDVLGGQTSRGIAGYQTALAGQMAQEGLYQQAAESLRNAQVLSAQEHQRAYQNQLANQAWLREGQQLQAGEDRYAFGTEQQASQDAYQRYLSGEELQQRQAQQELARYQAWANQQAQQQQMAIQMYLGRGGLAAGQDQLALQQIAEQNRYNKWQWENFGNLLG